jgi:putative hydrolase of the HAD superfamily
MRRAVLFDLGNTLVHYFFKAEFPALLEQGIAGVRDYLGQVDLLRVSPECMWRNVKTENHEAQDHRVRSLEGRLQRIFQLEPARAVTDAMCRAFLQPLLAGATPYEDSWSTLDALRARGWRVAIVSNLPWGSPAAPWREEVARQGLSQRVDAVVFCADAGWRKPARQIFAFTLAKLRVCPQDCVFVGDDPRWDLAGPRSVGMEAVLLDRHGLASDSGETALLDLGQFLDWLAV